MAAAASDRSDRVHSRVWRAQLLCIYIWGCYKNLSLLLSPTALQSPQSVGVMMWTETAWQLPRASLMMLRLRARRPPDNLTPVGSKKLCFSPRSNFPESEWRSYSRFTNERKSLCFDSQSDFDLHRALHSRDPASLGSRRSPEAKHSAGPRHAASYLFWLPQNTLESKTAVKMFIICGNTEMLLMMSDIWRQKCHWYVNEVSSNARGRYLQVYRTMLARVHNIGLKVLGLWFGWWGFLGGKKSCIRKTFAHTWVCVST